MIRKLTEADRGTVMSFVGQEPALNLFIIGDIENFGFEKDFQEVWGEFDAADGRLKAVLLRYYGNFLPYAVGAFDVKGFSEIILSKEHVRMVSGESGVSCAFREAFSFRKERHMYFAELTGLNGELSQEPEPAGDVKCATEEDVEAVCRLLDRIEEFDNTPSAMRESMRRTITSGTGRTYFVEREGQVIATASTSAENSMSAMVVGVATHPSHRGQGLASLLVAQLCSDVLAEGRTLCLFYDNPSAGAIYKRIGFRDIGRWSMLDI